MRQFLHYYTSQFQTKYAHLADKEDPSVLNVQEPYSSEMLAMLRFTSLQMDGSVLRQKNQRETDDTVKAFLQLRPDRYAINPKSKQIFLLEFTRAMDTDPHWEVYKDAEKSRRYTPVLDFFNASCHTAVRLASEAPSQLVTSGTEMTDGSGPLSRMSSTPVRVIDWHECRAALGDPTVLYMHSLFVRPWCLAVSPGAHSAAFRGVGSFSPSADTDIPKDVPVAVFIAINNHLTFFTRQAPRHQMHGQQRRR